MKYYPMDTDLQQALNVATEPNSNGDVMLVSNGDRAVITGMFILEQVRRDHAKEQAAKA